MPFNNLPEGVLVSGQAFSHQLGIVLFRRAHAFNRHHITM
jgi:hypothetical protein